MLVNAGKTAAGSPVQVKNQHRELRDAQPHSGETAASSPAQEKRLPVLLCRRTGNLYTTMTVLRLGQYGRTFLATAGLLVTICISYDVLPRDDVFCGFC